MNTAAQSPPDHDDDAERALLGAMLISAPAVAQALTLLSPGQLYRPYHQLIWAAIVENEAWGDVLLIQARLVESGHLPKLPSTTYLHDCVRACTTPANLSHYARLVTEAAARRDRTTLAVRLARAAELDDRGLWAKLVEQAATETPHPNGQPQPPAGIPPIYTLRERLTNPLPPTQWRIHDWQPAGSRVIIAAQYKAGKTTLIGNLIRSLTDHDLFLGRYRIQPMPGRTVLLDFEMGPRQLDTWLADQRIVNDDWVTILPLRGAAGAFNIVEPVIRAWWVAMLRHQHCSYLIWDCLRPVMDALGLDEHHDAGRLLTAFDALLAEAGIGEAAVVHHMGHSGERSRGDSRLRDWPDAEWRLVRQDEEPASARYLTGYGRDVDMPETLLHYEPTTRRLSINAGGSRQDTAVRSCLDDMLDLLNETPGMSGRALERAMMSGTDHGQKTIRQALKNAVRDGWIVATLGPRRATLYWPHK